MVVQCRPPRRISPDSLSVTDSEAESLSKYNSPRGSLHQDDLFHHHHPQHHHHTNSIHSVSSVNNNNNRKRTPPAIETDSMGEIIRSPTFSTASTPIINDHINNNNNNNNSPNNLNNNNNNTTSSHRPSPTGSNSVKAYRKSLKQHVQNTIIQAVPVSSKIVSNSNNNNQNGLNVLNPQTTAKSFSRVVARSRAVYNITQWIYDIYSWKHTLSSVFCVTLWIALCLYPSLLLIIPPALVIGLYIHVGVKPTTTASQALVPRYDENSADYFSNLERTQQSMQFLIRIYDNIAYHLGHVWLTPGSYRILTMVAITTSLLFWALGRWIIMLMGLVILTNKTWVGSTAEICLQFFLEVIQTTMEVFQKLISFSFRNKKNKDSNNKRKNGSFTQPIEISIYENQRWWAGSGYTSQLLRSERAGWSNLTGSEPLPSKDEMPPPSSYEWGETEWELDITGPWTDEQLGLGWVYSDHRWQNPRGRPDRTPKTKPTEGGTNNNNGPENTRPLTRRRRWYRKAYPILSKSKKLV
ncbi:hypothetical protein INT45_013068 [Circinella minor]|uniref:TECPR1-like DysF domain-containing protein n=1 Tax=Circinella minor TaxID=1195481 RepID=A0A8H7VHL6_9FUNG|nr:hypothetical protein INT45_013068 [Circinella minor]